MEQVVDTLRTHFPAITYRPGEVFYWSPASREVFYVPEPTDSSGIWSLLHETAHAILNHQSYRADFELIKMEVAAWEQAKILAAELGVTINEDHIQDCLDTYRDWLCARSICPYCSSRALQQADLQYYQCFNCHTRWRVTPSRFCRAYRATVPVNTDSLLA